MEEYIKEYKIIEKTEIQKEIELIKTIIDTREKLKDELQNQKVLIEDLFVTLNNEKQKIKDVAFKELKDELELSNDRIKNRKKSIKFFWINILVSLLSFFLLQ